MNSDLITGIDIGTSKVAVTIGQYSAGGESLELLGVGKEPAEGIDRGKVANSDLASRSIGKTVQNAQEMAATNVQSVNVSVTGLDFAYLESSGTISRARNSDHISFQDIKRAIEVSTELETDPSRTVLCKFPTEFTVDGQTGISNPLGMEGRRIDTDLTVITAPVNAIRNLYQCLDGISLDVNLMLPSPLPTHWSTVGELEHRQGTVLVDVGGEVTEVSVLQGGQLLHSANVPLGGVHLTKDLSAGLNLSFPEAEYLKKREGVSGLSEPPGVAPEDYVSIEGPEGKDIDVSREKMTRIMRLRLEEIFDLALEKVRSQAHAETIQGMILTGGCSELPGLGEFVAANYPVKVRKGRTISGITGLTDILQNPVYATSLGLLKSASEFPFGVAEWGDWGTELQSKGMMERLKDLLK